ncbi:RNA-binding cell elongation regulator Jag/EloR [Sporosarcina sp. FA9]|uniref:RNA-binding cell elongation regulator Jag/EloR n=1 Tax=Sporosarcina sp. FA9 TaxID=3413030 RepID=UPI003F65A8BD
MKKLTRRGANVEEAISAALKTLGVARDQVKVEVIDKGKKGFLGFGAKEAEVTVTVTEVIGISPALEDLTALPPKTRNDDAISPLTKTSEEIVDSTNPIFQRHEASLSEKPSDKNAILETENYLKQISSGMGINDFEITSKVDGKYVTFQLESKKAALLIGKRGQTLNALQQLSQLVTNKYASQFKVVRIDVGDYRDRREQSLEQLADRMADKAVRSGRKVQLEPMPSYERKVIHNALSNRLDIETFSEGSDPYRYLTIEPIR